MLAPAVDELLRDKDFEEVTAAQILGSRWHANPVGLGRNDDRRVRFPRLGRLQCALRVQGI